MGCRHRRHSSDRPDGRKPDALGAGGRRSPGRGGGCGPLHGLGLDRPLHEDAATATNQVYAALAAVTLGARRLSAAHEFLLRIRIDLHFAAGRAEYFEQCRTIDAEAVIFFRPVKVLRYSSALTLITR